VWRHSFLFITVVLMGKKKVKGSNVVRGFATTSLPKRTTETTSDRSNSVASSSSSSKRSNKHVVSSKKEERRVEKVNVREENVPTSWEDIDTSNTIRLTELESQRKLAERKVENWFQKQQETVQTENVDKLPRLKLDLTLERSVADLWTELGDDQYGKLNKGYVKLVTYG
jgi:hypothetical protein